MMFDNNILCNITQYFGFSPVNCAKIEQIRIFPDAVLEKKPPHSKLTLS